MATAVTSLRIPTDLSERYSRLAKETGRSRSYYVNEALADSIDRLEYVDELEESLSLAD